MHNYYKSDAKPQSIYIKWFNGFLRLPSQQILRTIYLAVL